ncbi:MAG: glycosyltransferase [Chlorobiaceae bacterium]|nr:glycosyltransferase [Chlorobiaceae bacterium]
MYTSAKGMQDVGVDVHLEYLGNLRSPKQIARMRKHLREIASGFDVVHAQYGSACAYVTSAVIDKPTVLTMRGNDWEIHKSTVGFHYLHTRLAKWLTCRSLSSFSVVISVSKRMQKSISEYDPSLRYMVLPDPIDLGQWPRNHSRAIRNGEKRVLYTSQRLADPIKGYDLCKKVIELANSRLDGVVLCTANDIPYSKMPEFVSSCDAILCTSESEGWPNSIKEALACNLPFVSTDVSDLADIASQEPSCRVCRRDAEELAANLCEVLQMKRPDNLRKYVEPMDIRSSSEKLLALYESLVRN